MRDRGRCRCSRFGARWCPPQKLRNHARALPKALALPHRIAPPRSLGPNLSDAQSADAPTPRRRSRSPTFRPVASTECCAHRSPCLRASPRSCLREPTASAPDAPQDRRASFRSSGYPEACAVDCPLSSTRRRYATPASPFGTRGGDNPSTARPGPARGLFRRPRAHCPGHAPEQPTHVLSFSGCRRRLLCTADLERHGIASRLRHPALQRKSLPQRPRERRSLTEFLPPRELRQQIHHPLDASHRVDQTPGPGPRGHRSSKHRSAYSTGARRLRRPFLRSLTADAMLPYPASRGQPAALGRRRARQLRDVRLQPTGAAGGPQPLDAEAAGRQGGRARTGGFAVVRDGAADAEKNGLLRSAS